MSFLFKKVHFRKLNMVYKAGDERHYKKLVTTRCKYKTDLFKSNIIDNASVNKAKWLQLRVDGGIY